ncbi:uncharacterized protein LOC124349291 isoform X1 [Daphnia pulicaria]|uniref:uncharacterized protein LOC124349291 isoform X1 n=1 Tax=Daphnia pulicaria TaxID=35523 RepID=UPI001EEB234D|nr:uncharacterized protein LOC124349291 isoform X1 [Daphnia pulicaria]
MIILLLILSLVATIVISTPIPQKDITLFPETTVEVLKQIYRVNGDGSYSFGFKASDGTFLVERKDADGYVTGEFGYTKQQLQISEYLYNFDVARKLLGFPFPAIDGNAYSNANTSSVLKVLDDSDADVPIEVHDATELQIALLTDVEKNKTLPPPPDRPKFFKYGEAIFRSPSNISESVMWPNPSKIDQFMRDLKSFKLYPS